jgi:hypothetical protein
MHHLSHLIPYFFSSSSATDATCVMQERRTNEEALPAIPAEILDTIARETSSFAVDGQLSVVLFFKNRLKLACLNKQQLALFRVSYTDEKLYCLFEEMCVIGKFHESVYFTRQFADIAFFNASYYEMIKKIMMLRDSRESSFLNRLICNLYDIYELKHIRTTAASGKINVLHDDVAQVERKHGDPSLSVDLYFALIRAGKYGDKELIKVSVADRKNCAASFNQLFVSVDGDWPENSKPLPKRVAVNDDTGGVDLCRLWPLKSGRAQHEKQTLFIIENYPEHLFEKIDPCVPVTEMRFIIYQNAKEIVANQEVVAHFEKVLVLYVEDITVKREKASEEKKARVRLLREEKRLKKEEEERKAAEIVKQAEQARKIRQEKDEEERYRQMLRFRGFKDLGGKGFIPFDTPANVNDLYCKIGWLKLKGYILDCSLNDGKLSLVLAQPELAERVMTVVNADRIPTEMDSLYMIL